LQDQEIDQNREQENIEMNYAASELMAVMSARLLKDGQAVFAGIGIPLLASTLAQNLHAQGLTIVFEGGVLGPIVAAGDLPGSPNEQRCARRANMLLSITDVMLLLQRGYVDFGFMGGAEIDCYGNLNSSFIGGAKNPKMRLPGTGGGNDIASLTQMIVVMKHEKRRFVDKVDFITSPGFMAGGSSRSNSGLQMGGMYRVITDLAILDFDDATRLMKVRALHPGISVEEVRDNTGFDIHIDDIPKVTKPPTALELAALRHLDSKKIYTA
jgi:glutaconate CoA-transferase subunit B